MKVIRLLKKRKIKRIQRAARDHVMQKIAALDILAPQLGVMDWRSEIDEEKQEKLLSLRNQPLDVELLKILFKREWRFARECIELLNLQKGFYRLSRRDPRPPRVFGRGVRRALIAHIKTSPAGQPEKAAA
jgi:hypothetical protein